MSGIAQSLFGGVALDSELDALFAAATAPAQPAAKSKKRKNKDAAPEAATKAQPASPAAKKSKKEKKPAIGTADSVEAPVAPVAPKAKKTSKANGVAAASSLPVEPSPSKKEKKKKANGAIVAPAEPAATKAVMAKKEKKSKDPKKAVAPAPSDADSGLDEDDFEATVSQFKQEAGSEDSDGDSDDDDDNDVVYQEAGPENSEGDSADNDVKAGARETKREAGSEDSDSNSENDGIKIDIDGQEVDAGDDSDSDDSDYEDTEDKPAAEGKKTRRQVKKETNEKNRRTVFIGNLSLKVTEKAHIKTLKAMFAPHGAIESIRFRSIARNEKMPRRAAFITKNFHPGRDTLNAYLVYKEKESAVKALAENGKLFLGNHIRVDKAMREKDEKHEYKRSVFVGALPFDVSEEKVWEFFSQCGDVEGVRVVRDKATNVGKGIGYVLFKDKACVALAMRLHGSELAGRKIRVNRCKDTSAEGKAKRLSEIEGTRASRSDPVKGGVSKFRTRNQNKSDTLRSGASASASGRGGRGGARGGMSRGGHSASATRAQGTARNGTATMPKDFATKIKPPQLGKAAYQRTKAAAAGVPYVKKARHVSRTPKQ
ncbi:RNA-binding protein 34 [Geranomyces variabilis]|uniref:Nucleolar protein 12 n=1 Tax=Geranomyces variabilis TaxID=109894 RepID=A0AAD5THM2_9FUNG|nr:RNA-binding protein 34 [Geranomyces variabilis]